MNNKESKLLDLLSLNLNLMINKIDDLINQIDELNWIIEMLITILNAIILLLEKMENNDLRNIRKSIFFTRKCLNYNKIIKNCKNDIIEYKINLNKIDSSNLSEFLGSTSIIYLLMDIIDLFYDKYYPEIMDFIKNLFLSFEFDKNKLQNPELYNKILNKWKLEKKKYDNFKKNFFSLKI